MTGKDFSDAMELLDDKYVTEAESYHAEKKRSALPFLIPLAGLLTAAAVIICINIFGAEPPIKLPTEGMEVVLASVDRKVYNNLTELEAACDIIVVGEFCEDTQQVTKNGGDIYLDTVSTGTVRVKEVLGGDNIFTGDKLKISQRYVVLEEENKLYSFSGLTPMNRGESWIFFLSYDEENETYWVTGDTDGRYPLPNGEMGTLYKSACAVTEQRDVWIKSVAEVYNPEAALPEGAYVGSTKNGELYTIPPQHAQQFIGYEMELLSLRDSINPMLFGVYDKENIKLSLYCEVVDKYFQQTDSR